MVGLELQRGEVFPARVPDNNDIDVVRRVRVVCAGGQDEKVLL